MKKIILSLLLLSIIFLYGCTDHKGRLKTRGSSAIGINKTANSSNMFAIDLYHELSKNSRDNMFFSPYSIYLSLSMLYEGSDGLTKDIMEKNLYIPSIKHRKENIAALISMLNSSEYYNFSTANSLWIQKGFEVEKDYKNTLKYYYGAEVNFVNFNNSSAVDKINEWVADKTDNKITNLFSKEQITQNTRLVLANAVYFRGDWRIEFEKDKTKEQDFYGLDKTSTVEMMHMEHKTYNYGESEDMQIVEIPYMRSNLSMFIILPKKDFIKFEKGLTLERIHSYQKLMTKKKISICIPKFKLKESYDLINPLSSIGLQNIFSSNADFSKITEESVAVDSVVHKSYIEVDEKGTVAVAATGVTVGITSMPPEQTVFCANHPFIFFIEDKTSGEILFMGRYVNPN